MTPEAKRLIAFYKGRIAAITKRIETSQFESTVLNNHLWTLVEVYQNKIIDIQCGKRPNVEGGDK